MGWCANGSLGYGAPSKGYNRETATAKLFPVLSQNLDPKVLMMQATEK